MLPEGLVLGRFQPFHVGHVEYLEAAKARCNRLFVGITNPEPKARVHTAANPARDTDASNPFTYLERALIVEAALRDDLGWDVTDYFITPAPLLQPERMLHFVPPPGQTTCFVTVYDDWGLQKSSELRSMGYDVTCLWERTDDSRITSGTSIRAQIRAGDDSWVPVIPPAAAAVVKQIVETARARGDRRFDGGR